MKRTVFVHATLACSAIALVATPAAACEQDPIYFKLPNETDLQAQDRAERIRIDRAIARSYDRETNDLENATSIYLARVVSRALPALSDGVRLPATTLVRPVKTFKGSTKSADRSLIDDGGTGLCEDRGDGSGAYADANRLVMVFEGLPETEARPRGIDSFVVEELRTKPLLYWLMGIYGPEEQ